jgi:hypothetical protein
VEKENIVVVQMMPRRALIVLLDDIKAMGKQAVFHVFPECIRTKKGK